MAHADAVPVLMYHHVSPSPGLVTVSPETFDAHMHWLARNGWHALRAEEFAGFLAGKPVPKRSVLITFDDGYLDNWVYAHPVLQRYGLTSLLFTISGWIGDGDVRAVAGQGRALPQMLDHNGCKQAVAEGRTDQVMMRWSEIEAARAAGTFEFHSHTHSHARGEGISCVLAAKKSVISWRLIWRHRATHCSSGWARSASIYVGRRATLMKIILPLRVMPAFAISIRWTNTSIRKRPIVSGLVVSLPRTVATAGSGRVFGSTAAPS